MRVAVHHPIGVEESHIGERGLHPPPHLAPAARGVSPGGHHQLIAHSEHRVQGRGGLLEDHRQLTAAVLAELSLGQAQELGAAIADRARGAGPPGQQAHRREGSRGLAAAGLSRHPEHLAGAQAQIHTTQSPGRRRAVAELHDEILDGQHLLTGLRLGGR